MVPHPDSAPQPSARDAIRVVIIEDEPDVGRMLRRFVETCGNYAVQVYTDPAQALLRLAEAAPDLVFTDLRMPGADGLDVIRRARELDPDLPVVVVSAFATLENAVEAIRTGAFDFLAKPFSPQAVELTLARLARDHRLRRRAADAARELPDPEIEALRGPSPVMQRLRDWVRRVRATRTSVLIEGESGTGKELVARAIHGRAGPFVAINMAAIPDELAEAELFGYEKGAYTGAARQRSGLLMQANGGTLFLDEVNAMSPGLQAKLLRVLQERRVRAVGADREVDLDFRLLAASNQDLAARVEEGIFRRDLYHRLKVLHVSIPPLREHPEDIPVLAQLFVERYARAHGCRARRLAADALLALRNAPWPGNVRELENTIEQAVILCPGNAPEIPLDVLPPELGGQRWLRSGAAGGTEPTLAEVERAHVLGVLARTGGNKARAARILGIDYKTLLRKLPSAET